MDQNEIKPEAEKVLKCYNYSDDEFSTARADSEDALKYLNNNQWFGPKESYAKEFDKPMVQANLILPTLATVVGNEQLSRRRARFKPTDMESVEMADLLQSRWNQINDEQDVEEKIQTVMTDALSTKIGGWIERSFELNERGYLDYKYRVANNFRVFLDPETKVYDYQLRSARWIVKESWEPLDLIKDKFDIPSDLKQEYQTNWWEKLVDSIKRITESAYSNDTEGYDKENDKYKILELQERVSRKVFKCTDGNTYLSLTPKEYKKYKDKIPNLQKLYTDHEQRIHITTTIPYFNHAVVADRDHPIPTKNFDLFPMFSYNFNIQVTESTSMVDLLIDLQDIFNKRKSQTQDYISQILAGATFFSSRDQKTADKYRKEGNQPNFVGTLKNIHNKPVKLSPDRMPPDITTDQELTLKHFDRVSMQPESMRGESGKSGESGDLFQQKVQRAAAAINIYYKNAANLRKSLARDFADNLPYVYTEPDRPIKVKNEKDQVSEALLNLSVYGKKFNNVENLSLQVELDEGEDNLSSQETNFNKMVALADLIANVNPALVDVKTLVANAPVPDNDKWAQHIDQILQAQSQEAQEQKNIERQKEIIETQKEKKDMLLDEEKLRLEKQKEQHDQTIDEAQLQLEKQKMQNQNKKE